MCCRSNPFDSRWQVETATRVAVLILGLGLLPLGMEVSSGFGI